MKYTKQEKEFVKRLGLDKLYRYINIKKEVYMHEIGEKIVKESCSMYIEIFKICLWEEEIFGSLAKNSKRLKILLSAQTKCKSWKDLCKLWEECKESGFCPDCRLYNVCESEYREDAGYCDLWEECK